MGTRHISKDSWSRCETQSMLYDATRSPTIAKSTTKPSINSISKDTIESTQQRLKREMMDKFQNKGLELPHESYVAVVQVGKYVFLAVMLPVYLCIYGIPRWLLVNALPQIFTAIKNPIVSVGHFIIEMTRRVADLMKGLLEQIIGDALRMGRDRAKNFMKRLSSSFNKFSKVISRLKREVASRIEVVKNKITKSNTRLYNKAKKAAVSINQWLAKRTSKVGAKSLKSLELIDRKVFTPFIQLLIPPFRLAYKTFNSIKLKVLERVKRNHEQLKKVLDPIIAFIKKQGKKVASKYLHPIIQWLSDKKETQKKHLIRLKNYISDQIRRAKNFIEVKIKKPILIALGFIKQLALIVMSIVKQSFRFISKFLPKGSKEKFHKFSKWLFKAKQPIGNLAKGLSIGFRAGLTFSRKLFSKAQGLVINFLKTLKQLFRWSFNKLKGVLRKGKCLLMTIYRVVSFTTAHVIFAGHVLIALMWVSCVYSFQLVHQMTAPKPYFKS